MSESIPRRGRIGRAVPLVGLAGRTAGEAVVASFRQRRRGEGKAAFHNRTAERYADHLGRSKGVLMKVGQILSFTTLGPAVGAENENVYMRAMSRLQDSAPPMPFETAAAVVEEELGAPIEVLFEEFAETPIAAASIGQVHAATLRDGRRVAVKVQYPGVDEAIRADLDNVELIGTFLQIARGFAPQMSHVDVRAMSAEIAARIGEEIDYRTEAANQLAFANAFRGHPYIRIPDVVPELSSSRVLTMDLVEGRRFADATNAPLEMRNHWGEVVTRFVGVSLRRFGLFNADPHPGNYLFHDDGGVTFLDFGCVKRLPPAQVAMLRQVANAAVSGDVGGTIRLLHTMGFEDATGKLTDQQLFAWFTAGMEMFTGPQPYTLTSEYAAQVIRDKYSPFGPHAEVLRGITLNADWTMMSRIDFGLSSILGALGCTGPWDAMRREWDCGAPPATAIGAAEAELWASLPRIS